MRTGRSRSLPWKPRRTVTAGGHCSQAISKGSPGGCEDG
jgi:hypothetical protein